MNEHTTVRLEKNEPGYEIPVVFIVFNRPDVTRRTFEAIAYARPTRLFIIADGARIHREGELDRVNETRDIVERIDWPCEVFRNYSNANMGCKQRISSGISWVFEHVDKAVILEDDCLAVPSFFEYCRAMLTEYENDMQIFSVSGSNFASHEGESGHYFSKYALMWGWATWRSRWHLYQLDPVDTLRVLVKTWWRRPVVLSYWILVFRSLRAQRIDTWDVQWILTVWRHDGLVCRPNQNLVQNIGFGPDATHTIDPDHSISSIQAYTGTGSYHKAVDERRADEARDRIDERVWGQINIRSVLLMGFPWIAVLKATLTKLCSR